MSKLTDKDIESIASVMEENIESSPDLKVLAEMPSNNGVEDSKENLEGYEVTQNVSIDPFSGLARPTDESVDYENGSDVSFEDLVERAKSGDFEEKVEITEDDIEKQINNDNDFFKDLDLSSTATLQILNVTKRVQNGEKFSVFKALPLEVQERLNNYMSINGIGDHSARSNEIRNDLAEMIINEFITNISFEKYTMDFQKEMNSLQNKVNEELSTMYMDYNENRDKYIRSLIEDTDDEEKKKIVGDILDSIQDGFDLNRIKEAAHNHKIKIKRFDIEKPKRSFDGFLNRYQKSTYNIYSIYTVYEVLVRHFKEEATNEEILKFLIAICKVTQNYKPENPVEHAFMYYAMYNPLLLDIYKGEEYLSFAPKYKANVLEIIGLLK